ncbi:phage tail tape measure protein [Arthrospiribacter ruber]|uniref:Phage tail tape measure protein n=1 Tax=Arthrospiribacter ruber TaxID=2487934 RepID=A0A951MDI2_9BACT|nr:phage tail tape measure protein [Arthrospiribacter ruber]MBW3469074.1 phage tail tape measure protein [Arthrospiribacter ruber]
MSNYTGKLNILIGGNAENFYSTIGGVQKKLQGFSRKLDNIAKDLSAKVSLPLTLLGGIATNVASDFSDSMLKVQGLTGATGDSFDSLTKKAKELGGNTAFSASQVADAMGYMALAGYDTNKILESIPATLHLASSAGGNLAKVTDIVTDTMSAFKMEAGETNKVVDVFAKAQGKANTSVEQLGEAFKYASSNASASNQSLIDSTSVLSVFANAGIKGSSAGTAFNAMLRDLKKSSEDGKVSIGSMGIALYDAEGQMRSIIDILQDVEKATSSMTQAQKDSALMSIFKEESIRGVNTVLNAGTSELLRYQDELINSEGFAKEFAETMESGLGGAFRRIKSSIESVLITIGEQLTPYVQLASEWVNKFSNAFNDLNPNLLKVATVIGVILAVVPPLVVAFGQIVKIVTSSIASIKVLLPLLSGISAPILGIAVAVGGAVYLIIKYWDELKEYFTSGTGSTITDSLTELWDKTTSSITSSTQGIVSELKAFWEEFGKDITDVFKSISNIVTTQLDNLIQIIGLAIRGVTAILTSIIRLLRGDFKGAWSAISDYVVDVFRTITGAVLSSFQAVLGVASTVAEKLGFDSIAGSIDSAITKLDEFKFKYSSLGSSSDTSVSVDGSSSTVDSPIINTVVPVAGVAGVGERIKREILEPIKLVKKEFDITSAFAGSKIKEIGKNVVDSSAKMYEALTPVTWTFDQYMNYFSQFEKGMFVLGEGLLTIGDGIQRMFMDLFRTGQFSFKGLIQAVGAFVAKLLGAIAAAAILNVLTAGLFAGAGAGTGLNALKEAFTFTNLLGQFSGGLLGSRANGGDVKMNNPYIVGERGRELFIPSTSGTIIPNHLLATASTASGGNVTFRIRREELVGILRQDSRLQERF